LISIAILLKVFFLGNRLRGGWPPMFGWPPRACISVAAMHSWGIEPAVLLYNLNDAMATWDGF
jgi:hypothetical protein